MNTLKIFSLALITISTNSYAAGNIQIHDQGQDGSQRNYLVTCPDGSRTSLTQHFEFQKTNTENIDKEEIEKKRERGLIIASPYKPPKLIETCIHSKTIDNQCMSPMKLETAAKKSCS